ncbi:MAG TPA: hypothetical protein VNS79_13950 [Sphingobium sp.]|nr:hypothetical protein [Sphingobium sp.]
MRRVMMPAFLLLALSACQSGGADGTLPGNRDDTQPFGEIAMDDTVHFSGTEPFWGGEVTGEQLIYKTPDDQDGQTVTVSRFAGRAGLSYSGTLEGAAFTMAITTGKCSDGMSDRIYPYVVTLQLADAMRSGCAWSDKHPFEGPQTP